MEAKDIRFAARELNEVLGLKPPFDDKQRVEILKEEIMQVIRKPNMIDPDDVFSPVTQAVIDALL